MELFTLLIVVALLLGGFSAYHRLRTAKAEAQLSVIKLTPSGGATLTGGVSDAAIEAVTAGWASHSRSRTPVAGQSAPHGDTELHPKIARSITESGCMMPPCDDDPSRSSVVRP